MIEHALENNIEVCIQHPFGCNEPPIWRAEFWNRGKDPDVDPISALGICHLHLEEAREKLEGVQRLLKEKAGGFRIVPNNQENKAEYNTTMEDLFKGGTEE